MEPTRISTTNKNFTCLNLWQLYCSHCTCTCMHTVLRNHVSQWNWKRPTKSRKLCKAFIGSCLTSIMAIYFDYGCSIKVRLFQYNKSPPPFWQTTALHNWKLPLTSSAELGVVFLLILFQLEMFPPCMYNFFANWRASSELNFVVNPSIVTQPFDAGSFAIVLKI